VAAAQRVVAAAAAGAAVGAAQASAVGTVAVAVAVAVAAAAAVAETVGHLGAETASGDGSAAKAAGGAGTCLGAQ